MVVRYRKSSCPTSETRLRYFLRLSAAKFVPFIVRVPDEGSMKRSKSEITVLSPHLLWPTRAIVSFGRTERLNPVNAQELSLLG